MTTDYDPIAEQYKRSKETPWRTDVECFTLMRTIGPVQGPVRAGPGVRGRGSSNA